MSGSRRWPIAVAALVFTTAAVIIGLLDHERLATTVVYPRDLQSADQGDGDGAGERGEGPTASAARGDRPLAAPPADRDGALRVPGRLPKLGSAATARGREALRRALAAPDSPHLMVDFMALRRSPLAERIMRCRGARAQEALARIRDELGVDVDRDVESIGFGGGVFGVAGNLDDLKLDDGAGSGGRTVRRYRGAELFAIGDDGRVIARLANGLVLLADDEASLRAAIDRVNGDAPASDDAVGAADVQGSLRAADVHALLGRRTAEGVAGGEAAGAPNAELDAIATLIAAARLRMNVDDHAAISLDLDTAGSTEARDLGKAMAAALTVARQVARREGRDALLRLLDQARILDPRGGSLGVDLAVPGGWILDRMGCDAEGRPHPARSGGVGETASGGEAKVELEVIAPDGSGGR